MGLFCDPENAIFPILASTKCDYKVPLTYPDTIIVYEITSTAQNCVAAVGEGVVVCVDKATGKPVPVPDDIRQKLDASSSG